MRYRRLRLETLETRHMLALPAEAPPFIPPPAAADVFVDTAAELETAVRFLQSNQTIIIAPGVYQLTRPLYIGAYGQQLTNVTIRGATNDFNDVVIRGQGMESRAVSHGISIWNAQDVTIANLSVGDVYFHAIDLQGIMGADRVRLYHNRFFDAGEQIIKSNAGGGGVDDTILEYCLIEYTNGPSVIDHGGGTGYGGGLHAHETDRWIIRNNLFRNFHTPDGVQFTYNPVVLMWAGSSGTVVDGNTFIDCDRAVALGLMDKPVGFDHQGGTISNNFIYQRPGLFSASRRVGSDAQILVYDSPGTQVYHNTIMTNGNSRLSIEVRWATGIPFENNLADAPLGARNGGSYLAAGNYLSATPAMFVNPGAADLHLLDSEAGRASVIDRAVARAEATHDFDGDQRPLGPAADIGADEWGSPAGTPAFVGLDTVSQGNWQTLHGADGYIFAQGAANLPSYAQVSLAGQLDYVWAGSTSDPRALQKPGQSDRLAATWYSTSSFTVDINLSGSQTRQVALYLLDWDNYGPRSQRLDVLDAGTGQVLDTRTASSFVNGQYLVWTLGGHVQIRITNLAGPSSAAALSGIFFGGTTAPSSATAAFVGSDVASQGNWQTLYGADGYRLAQGPASLPGYAQVTVSGQSDYTWASSTSDPRALQKPGQADRLAATWYSTSSFTVDINLSGSQTRQVALYLLDWDNFGPRSQRLEVLDAGTGQVLDTRTVSSLGNGQYLVWTLGGHVQIRVTNLAGPATNAVLGGILFGGPTTT